MARLGERATPSVICFDLSLKGIAYLRLRICEGTRRSHTTDCKRLFFFRRSVGSKYANSSRYFTAALGQERTEVRGGFAPSTRTPIAARGYVAQTMSSKSGILNVLLFIASVGP